MGKTRECFLCEMLLSLLEHEKVEATVCGKSRKLVEVCARCLAKVVKAGAVATCIDKVTVVLRPRMMDQVLDLGRPSTATGLGGHRG